MIEFTIKTLDSLDHNFSVDDEITVQQLKERVNLQLGVPARMQRLIFCGRVLQDDRRLADYNVHGKVVHMVQRPPPNDAAQSTSRGTGNPSTSGSGNNRTSPSGNAGTSGTAGGASASGASASGASTSGASARGVNVNVPAAGLRNFIPWVAPDVSEGPILSPTTSRMEYLQRILKDIRGLIRVISAQDVEARPHAYRYPGLDDDDDDSDDDAPSEVPPPRRRTIENEAGEIETVPAQFGEMISELRQLESTFHRYRDVYVEILRESENEAMQLSEEDLRHRQRQAEISSELFHSFAHAYHLVSDITFHMQQDGNSRLTSEAMPRNAVPLQPRLMREPIGAQADGLPADLQARVEAIDPDSPHGDLDNIVRGLNDIARIGNLEVVVSLEEVSPAGLLAQAQNPDRPNSQQPPEPVAHYIDSGGNIQPLLGPQIFLAQMPFNGPPNAEMLENLVSSFVRQGMVPGIDGILHTQFEHEVEIPPRGIPIDLGRFRAHQAQQAEARARAQQSQNNQQRLNNQQVPNGPPTSNTSNQQPQNYQQRTNFQAPSTQQAPNYQSRVYYQQVPNPVPNQLHNQLHTSASNTTSAQNLQQRVYFQQVPNAMASNPSNNQQRSNNQEVPSSPRADGQQRLNNQPASSNQHMPNGQQRSNNQAATAANGLGENGPQPRASGHRGDHQRGNPSNGSGPHRSSGAPNERAQTSDNFGHYVYDKFLNCDSPHARRVLSRRREEAGGPPPRNPPAPMSRFEEIMQNRTNQYFEQLDNESLVGSEYLVLAAILLSDEFSIIPVGPQLTSFGLSNLRRRFEGYFYDLMQHPYRTGCESELANLIFEHHAQFIDRLLASIPLRPEYDVITSLKTAFCQCLEGLSLVMENPLNSMFIRCFRVFVAHVFTEMCGVIAECSPEGVEAVRHIHDGFLDAVVENVQEPLRTSITDVAMENVGLAINKILTNRTSAKDFLCPADDGASTSRANEPFDYEQLARDLNRTPPLTPPAAAEPSPDSSEHSTPEPTTPPETPEVPDTTASSAPPTTESSAPPTSESSAPPTTAETESASPSEHDMEDSERPTERPAEATSSRDTLTERLPDEPPSEPASNLLSRANRRPRSPSSSENSEFITVFVPPEDIRSHWGEEWVPTFTRDVRRQSLSTEPYSNAYLAGMPPQKRRCIRQSRPTPNIGSFFHEALREAARINNVAPAPRVLRQTFREHIRTLTELRTLTSEDYDPQRFVATARFVKGKGDGDNPLPPETKPE